MRGKPILSFPLHPLIVATVPLVHFYQVNFQSLYLRDLGEPLLLFALAALLLLVMTRLIWKSWDKAGLIASGMSYWIFWTGDYAGWKVLLVFGIPCLVAVALRWVRKPFPNLTLSLNVASAVLFLFPFFLIFQMHRQLDSPRPRTGYDEPVDFNLAAGNHTGMLPDIYYIVADGLGRPDVLERMYGVPRAALTGRLEAMGFQIADRSLANYPQTALSMAATFNMAYVDEILEIPDRESGDRRPLGKLVARNRLVRSLKKRGYHIINYTSGYTFSRLEGTDAEKKPLLSLDFVSMHVLNKTILPRLQRLFGRGPSDLRFALHRHRLRYVLNDLPGARKSSPTTAPVFVFAHLLTPHPPFVFGRDGQPLSSHKPFSFKDGNHWRAVHQGDGVDYRQSYREQTLFLLDRLTSALGEVKRTSTRPVVIIVQGDHGPGAELEWENPRRTNIVERLGIFNAWLIPDDVELVVDPRITSVNTFPLVLNSFLGADLPMRPNQAWFVRWIWPYKFYSLNPESS